MKISIITACYKAASTLETALRSVVEQDYPDIEYIIIDGGSTDGTPVLLETYKEHIDTLISEPDNGIYDALNKGIVAASGDYVGFLHADDFYPHKNVITRIARKLKESTAEALYGDLHYVSKANPEKVIRKWISGDFSMKKLRQGWMPPHPALFLKRELYLKNGNFDTSFQIAADYDLIIRNLKLPDLQVVYLPELLYVMRVGGESNKSLKNIIQKSREDMKALRKNEFGGRYTLILKNFRKIGQFF